MRHFYVYYRGCNILKRPFYYTGGIYLIISLIFIIGLCKDFKNVSNQTPVSTSSIVLTNETIYFWSGKQVQYYLHIIDYIIISLYMNILKLKLHFISFQHIMLSAIIVHILHKFCILLINIMISLFRGASKPNFVTLPNFLH